jgi:hypothetical protein
MDDPDPGDRQYRQTRRDMIESDFGGSLRKVAYRPVPEKASLRFTTGVRIPGWQSFRGLPGAHGGGDAIARNEIRLMEAAIILRDPQLFLY